MDEKELVIIGSGVAGLSAAVYTGRANIETLVIRGDDPGGQLTLTTEVENYPGFEDGIDGTALISNIESQAQRFGAEFKNGIVSDIDVEEDNGRNTFFITLESGDTIAAQSVIIASGSSVRTLGIQGEDKLMGYGVSTCATCDGAFFRGEDMVVVGGGDAAFEESTFLTNFADTVYLVHRREEFRAEEYWQERVQEKVDSGEIEILKNTEVTQINGSIEDGVNSVNLIRHPDGHPKKKRENGINVEEQELEVSAVFLAIGHIPNTDFVRNTDIALDENGYIITEKGRGEYQTKTTVPGVFAAGDVVDYHYQQAATASGMGVKAALDVDEYLTNSEKTK